MSELEAESTSKESTSPKAVPIQLFAKQKRIYPKKVWGKYSRLKWLIMFATLSVYYLLPWLRWDRGINVPDQAVLIDMPNRRAYFFFIEIWPQEVYYLAGLLILAAIVLFFVTSLFGRVWCGYACPQTVWTDLFVWVERLFQGDRNARMRRDKTPYSLDTLWRKGATHSSWLLIGLLTGGACALYFNDAPTLLEQALQFDVPWSIMSWVLALTGSTYLMAGFAREQVCTYACPYSRFQSAMFDVDTLIIGYDESRGEPRGSHKEGENWADRGHCIDCKVCVHVCPMGIDIRNGLQMECIACGLCVDACNEIMDKVGLPQGLIRYDTVNNQQNRLKGLPEALQFLRPRTIYYVLITCVVSGVMLYGLATRSLLDLHVLHDRNPLFVKLSNGSIRNGYDIKILNKTHENRNYALSVAGINDAKISVQGVGDLDIENLSVLADSIGHFRIFVVAKKQLEPRLDIMFKIEDQDIVRVEQKKSIFVSSAKR